MTSLTYVALSDDDLIESARYLPVGQIKAKHIQAQVLKTLRKQSQAEIVVLHRADASITLKNSFEGVSWR